MSLILLKSAQHSLSELFICNSSNIYGLQFIFKIAVLMRGVVTPFLCTQQWLKVLDPGPARSGVLSEKAQIVP